MSRRASSGPPLSQVPVPATRRDRSSRHPHRLAIGGVPQIRSTAWRFRMAVLQSRYYTVYPTNSLRQTSAISRLPCVHTRPAPVLARDRERPVIRRALRERQDQTRREQL